MHSSGYFWRAILNVLLLVVVLLISGLYWQRCVRLNVTQIPPGYCDTSIIWPFFVLQMCHIEEVGLIVHLVKDPWTMKTNILVTRTMEVIPWSRPTQNRPLTWDNFMVHSMNRPWACKTFVYRGRKTCKLLYIYCFNQWN